MITITVDDNPLIIQSVQEGLLQIDPDGIHQAAESGNGALLLAGQLRPDVVFLDIELPDGNGIDIARQLKSLRPQTNIVFITGHAEYALPAFELYASGFLLKPVTEAQLAGALKNLRYPIRAEYAARAGQLRVRCFGQFEVWCDGQPVTFKRSRSKELFAYLIDRNGAMCSIQQIISIFWPEVPSDQSRASQIRVFIADLQTTLTKYGFGEVLIRQRGCIGVDASLLDCDYYKYLAGTVGKEQCFHGEYMSQYSFGEMTLALLSREIE